MDSYKDHKFKEKALKFSKRTLNFRAIVQLRKQSSNRKVNKFYSIKTFPFFRKQRFEQSIEFRKVTKGDDSQLTFEIF